MIPMATSPKTINFAKLTEATAFVRAHQNPRTGEPPTWTKYEALVNERFRDDFNLRIPVPLEFTYAYYRARGLSDAEVRKKLGIQAIPSQESRGAKAKGFWARLFS